MRPRALALILAAAALLPACSTKQVYGAAQAWQRTECTRMPDPDQRERCLASSAKSYEEYQREIGVLR